MQVRIYSAIDCSTIYKLWLKLNWLIVPRKMFIHIEDENMVTNIKIVCDVWAIAIHRLICKVFTFHSWPYKPLSFCRNDVWKVHYKRSSFFFYWIFNHGCPRKLLFLIGQL
jgi:hypothetical protein